MKSGIIKLVDHKCGISQRKAARKIKCNQSFICKTLETKTFIRKRKIPARTDFQKSNALKLCDRIFRNFCKRD